MCPHVRGHSRWFDERTKDLMFINKTKRAFSDKLDKIIIIIIQIDRNVS